MSEHTLEHHHKFCAERLHGDTYGLTCDCESRLVEALRDALEIGRRTTRTGDFDRVLGIIDAALAEYDEAQKP